MSDVADDLDRLNLLLDAIPLECEGMTIGELDGYVAGLIVCPEPVLPAEWLPAVWGGKNGLAEFDGADEIAAAVLDHYNRIARELAEEPEAYAPVMEVDRTDGDLLWGPWINGFERATRLRADAWDDIAFGDDEEAAALFGTILAMNAFDHGESELTGEEEDEIDRTASDLIHSMVRHLMVWRTLRSTTRRPMDGARRAMSSAPAGPGAQEIEAGYVQAIALCPCGSGRTYGRCCNAH